MIKRICSGIFIAIIAVFLALSPAFITSTLALERTTEPTPEQLNNITQNCNGIKTSLLQLERADSRTRIFLGATYETVLSTFITPLSLRLAKNNQPDATLASIQTDFAKAQTEFRNSYTTYMREMDTLISTDCSRQPADFYRQLERARMSREALQKSTTILSNLIDRQIEAVNKLREKL